MSTSFQYAMAGALALLSAMGCSRARPLTVGSKNFTEQIVLGEIVAQQLERRLGGKVDRKLDLGGTLLAQQALRNGEIDLYPEYTGTALTAVLKLAPSPDAAAVLERVRAEYRRRWRLEWLDPLGFDNTFAMVVRGPDARAQGIETLTDAARRKQGWTLGVGYEFLQRPDGLRGLLHTYRLPLAGTPKSMDLGLLYSALEQKQVDMAAANAIRAGRYGAARRPALLPTLSGSRDRARRSARRASGPARGARPARRQTLRRRDAQSESPGGWQAPASRRSSSRVARHRSVRNCTLGGLSHAAAGLRLTYT